MRHKYKIAILLLLLVYSACDSGKKESLKNPLEVVLASNHPKIKRVMDSVEQYAVQIKFTQIERKEDRVHFKDYEYQVDSTTYFYPASTVKFPIAALSLVKLNSIENIDRNTHFYVEGDTLETTFAREIEKIFAVSDNEAYNRLFEFLGQQYINQQLQNLKLGPLRISHRLSTENAEEITTKPIIVYLNDSTTTLLPHSINSSARPLDLKGMQKGVGFIAEDSLLKEAFDFSLKNYYPIETQHQFLKTIIFHDQYQADQKLALTPDQIRFLHQAMQILPKDAGYHRNTYYDGYCKFFMYGDTKAAIPAHIKIYNKVGDAYGTLTDCAYIHDTKNGIEFLLTATILVNKNGIFNDDTYEYDEIGFPFLAELGRQLYDHQLQLKK